MKNMKIRAKLILGFSILLILTTAGSICAVIGVNGMASANTRLYDHEAKSLINIFKLIENIDLVCIQTRDLILNDENVKSPEKNVNDTLNNFETAFAKYETTVLSKPEEQELYENIKKQYTLIFKPIVAEILESVKDGAPQTTLISLAADLTKAADTITSDINKSIDLKQKHAESSVTDISYHAKIITFTIIAVITISIITALILTLHISDMITNPLVRITAFLNKAQTTGNLTFSAEERVMQHDMTQKDEIGTYINACARFIKRILEVTEKFTKLADGDLTVQMSLLSEEDSIGLAFNNMAVNFNTVLADIQRASNQITTGTQQIAQGAQELAVGSANQADSIEKFSVSLAEIDKKIQTNAGKAIDAQETSEEAGAMLELGIRSMREMLTAMKEIDESSKNITKVIKVIDDIAFQTNILALNAAVEAARAGQHGKGFAVVAEEVRNLAAKSAEAARETAELIEGSSEKVREGNHIVEKTNSSLEAVVTGAKQASLLLGEVVADSAGQAATIQEINRGIEHISNVVQENSSSAEESASASQEMAEQAAMLNSIITRFKLNTQTYNERIHRDNSYHSDSFYNTEL